MENRVLARAACAASVVVTFGNVALAADNCTGYDVLVTQTAETTDLGQGHTITFVRQTSVLITGDTPVFNLVNGDCQGSILTTPDGKTRASGHCARRDKDGDTTSIEWAQAPGATRNQWRLTGGTGKFAARTGSGWAEAARQDGKVLVVRWGGTCN